MKQAAGGTVAELVDRRAAAAPPREVADLADVEPGQGEPSGLTAGQLMSQTWRLVQNLADALPDDVTRFARQSLAEGDAARALSALVFACLHTGISLSTVEYAVLAECLLSVSEDISPLDHVTVGDVERPVLFEFVDLPDRGDGNRDAGTAGRPDDDSDEAITAVAWAIDRSVAARLGTQTSALGIWRAWRYPVTGAPWPPSTPYYLVEAQDEASAIELATVFYGGQDRAAGPGEPVVEVYPTGAELPPLHRAIQFAGELVFAASPPPRFTFADVFDGDPDADGLPQHVTRVSQEEAERLISYLLSGTPMLVADAQGEDVLDPARGQSVPLHLRTDGTWVWSDASAYYLREHLIGPPPAFHAYLQTAPDTADRVSDVTLHQAVAWLQSG
jgi:hypothetical protein